MAGTATTETGIAQQVVVRTKDVKKVYKMGKVEVHALKGISVEIGAGEYISIMGPSGSGKSTGHLASVTRRTGSGRTLGTRSKT